jgi:RHS repeat-associated protein
VDKQDGTDTIINKTYSYVTEGINPQTGQFYNDNDGRIKKITDHVDGNYTTSYGYDAFNRLVAASRPGDVRFYTYDEWGNLRSTPGRTLSYTNNASGAPATNRLNAVTWSGGTVNYGYDAAGNMTSEGATTYTYDAAGRMTAVSGYSGGSYGFDGDGKRVKKSEGGVTVYYVESSVLGKTAFEMTSNGLNRALVDFAGSTVALLATDGQFYWNHADHLGTGRKMTNTTGAVVYRGEFDPHGNALLETGSAALLNRKFVGYERDSETGLDYAINRYHASTQGRFTSPDPYNIFFEKEKGQDEREREQILRNYISQPQIWNKYVYVLNNPLKYVDPDGRRELTADDWRRLNRLYDEYKKADAAGDTDLRDAVGKAINEIAVAIDAVPQGTADPANLKAVFFAIDKLGDTSYGLAGTVSNGVTVTVSSGDWKCNIFCANSYAQGAGVGFGGKGVPTNSTRLGGLLGRRYPPVANDYADPSKKIPNFDVVSSPGLGDIVAYPHPGGLGHSAIYAGGNTVIYAGQYDVKTNTVTRTQRELGSPSITYRRYKP